MRHLGMVLFTFVILLLSSLEIMAIEIAPATNDDIKSFDNSVRIFLEKKAASKVNFDQRQASKPEVADKALSDNAQPSLSTSARIKVSVDRASNKGFEGVKNLNRAKNELETDKHTLKADLKDSSGSSGLGSTETGDKTEKCREGASGGSGGGSGSSGGSPGGSGGGGSSGGSGKK